jgi:hypothetical protein
MAMSKWSEIIDIKSMTGTLLLHGEPVHTYKVEKCDKCSRIEKLDKYGYQKSDPAMNLIWLCQECR